MPALSSLIQTPASQVSSPQILSDVGKYVETLNELKQNFGNEKKTKLKKHRTNRPRKSFLQMTVINCDGQEVSLNSVDFDTLKTLLTVKRTFLPPPPEIPGINHLHIVQTLETLLLHNLKVSVIGEFPYRLAAYYLSENAFFKCFFPKLDSETSKPKSRKMILKTEYAKLLKYYALFFGGALFDHIPKMQNAWMESVRTAMNAAVDRLHHVRNTGKPIQYITYNGHIPPLNENNAFE
uniref:Uncharacterized protein n=1 Tax=Panagrolaimus sp. PS1159 TaxID=55785 RepID=A0AC35FG58_9BILA